MPRKNKSKSATTAAPNTVTISNDLRTRMVSLLAGILPSQNGDAAKFVCDLLLELKAAK